MTLRTVEIDTLHVVR